VAMSLPASSVQLGSNLSQVILLGQRFQMKRDLAGKSFRPPVVADAWLYAAGYLSKARRDQGAFVQIYGMTLFQFNISASEYCGKVTPVGGHMLMLLIYIETQKQ
jgi:hypothetical protein